jgi:hypothetical protein
MVALTVLVLENKLRAFVKAYHTQSTEASQLWRFSAASGSAEGCLPPKPTALRFAHSQ